MKLQENVTPEWNVTHHASDLAAGEYEAEIWIGLDRILIPVVIENQSFC